MANAEYSDNPDRKYLAKGKHGIPKKTLFKSGPGGSVKYSYPHIKPSVKFISKSPKKGV